MSDRQLELGAAPVHVGGPGQRTTRLSPEIPGDASVNIGWYIERARQLEAANGDSGQLGAGLTVRVADTDEEAIRLPEQIHPAKDFARTLAELGRTFGRLDFSQYDLDAPFPAEAVEYGQNSFRTRAEKIARVASEENLSLRETVRYFERRIRNRSPSPRDGRRRDRALAARRGGRRLHRGHDRAERLRAIREVVRPTN